MNFKIEHAKTERNSFGNCMYNIFRDGKLDAYYWHDYRGDEHGITFLNGKNETWPVGRMIDFIEGEDQNH
jgi:hypothetical protein